MLTNEGKVIESVSFFHRPRLNFMAVMVSHGIDGVCLQSYLVVKMMVVSFLRGDMKSFSEF